MVTCVNLQQACIKFSINVCLFWRCTFSSLVLVPSQVVLARTLAKKQMLMSVATKIGIQLNCKMGGEVWALEIPLKNLMVVGIDCYHDSAKKGRSVGAFIASMNQTFTRYYSRCTFQSNMEELMNALKVCMQGRVFAKNMSLSWFWQIFLSGSKVKLWFWCPWWIYECRYISMSWMVAAALKKYHEVNGQLPDKIVVYRHGVGDGQLATVHEHEVKQLIDCFKSVGTDYE